MILDEFVAKLGFIYSGDAPANRFKRELESIDNAAQGAATALSKIGLAISGALAGFAIGNKVGQFIGDITQTGRTFEELGVRLKSLEGSSEAARKAMDWITDFAVKTPLELTEVANAYASLRGYGLDPTAGSLQSITDTMAATGGGAEKLNGIVIALGQAWTKQKFQGEEAMQLMERGVPVWDLLSKATGKSAVELMSLSEKGKLGRKEIQLLIDQMGKRFAGASEEYAKTFTGILSKLHDQWTKFLKSISDSGYFTAAKARLQQFSDILEDMDENGTLDGMARGISTSLVGVMDIASHLAMQAYRIGKGFYYAADGVISLSSRMTGLSKTATAFGMGAGLIASTAMGRSAIVALAKRVPMVAAFLVLDDLMSGLAGDDSVIGSLEGGEAALERVRQSFADAYTAAEGLADSINGIFDISAIGDETQIDALLRSVKAFASGESVRFVNEMADALRQIGDILTFLSDAIKNPEDMFKRLANAFIAQIDRIVNALDKKLGGALTTFGFIGMPQLTKEAPKAAITATGRTTRAPVSNNSFTTMGDLERDGRVNAEGLGAQYKIDPDRLANGANAVGKFLLDLTSFNPQAENAKLMLKSLEGTFTAKVDVNTDAAMAKVQALKAELQALNGMRGRLPPQVGKAAVESRIGVIVSPSS